MKKVCLSTLLAFFLSSLCVAYENDGPGYDPNTPKKVRLMSSSNSFKPPEPSDICFVVTEGGDIGETKGQGETITIPLNISRYFGDKNKLLKSGALSEYAVLTMVVYDVDSKSSNNPEVDKVYLNGKKYLGTMWGDNAVYYQNQFIINTKDLNLAEYLGGVGSNTIDIKVDVNNGGWITHVKWISLYIPAAPPVILAHGINSSGAQLAKLAKEIEDQTGLPTYHYLNFNNHGNDHINNFSELAATVQAFKKICGVDHVNIVAHSMGGLRARGYAENANDVLKVLQIATPNGGSPIADFVVRWKASVNRDFFLMKERGDISERQYKQYIDHAKNAINGIAHDIANMNLDPWEDPAIVCLQTSEMKKYNIVHDLNPKVDYGVVAGKVTKHSTKTQLASWLVVRKRETVEDVVNEILSKYTAGDYTLQETLAVFLSQQLDTSFLQRPGGLLDNVFESGDLIVPVYSAHAKVAPLAGSPLEGPEDEVWHSGLIGDGAGRVVNLLKPKLIEQKTSSKDTQNDSAVTNSRRMFVRKATSKLSNSLTTEEDSDIIANDIQMGVAFSDRKTSVSFSILQGHHAMIILDISADEIKSTALRLKAPSGKVYEDCAQNVLMTNGISNAVVMLANPEKGKWTLEWTSAFSNSADIGIWTLAAFEVDDGVVFSPKLVNTSVAVGGTFALTVSPKVGEAVVSGTVKVVATAPNGTSAIYNATQDASGAFSAQIPATAVGTYTFAVMLDATSPSVFSRSIIISGVAHSGGAGFLQSHSAVVPDVDSNGLYDNLTVNLAVNATKAGTYRVLATLADTDGNEITEGWTSNIVCSAGTQTFPVAFDGRAIYGNGECGGYKVSSAKLLEVGEGYEAVVDERSDLFMTTVYTYKQFEHDLVAIKSGGSDSAVDVNGDGTYDRLDVTIPLYADDLATGSYEWSASLMDADGFLLGTASGYVTFISGQGGASISMSFDRDGIIATHKNGMYHVKNLIIWGNGRNLTIPGEYVTASYNIEDFGGKLATVDLGFILPQGWSDSLIISTNATAMTSQTVFEQGDPIYLNYAFKNVANQAAVSNFVNRFTLSNGSSYSDSWIGYGLKEGGWGWLGESFAPTMLQNLPAGTYTLTCELDVDGQLLETNEFNNVMDVTFTIKESLRPNLKISSASVSIDRFTVSDSVVFHWRVENMGRAAATKTKTAFRIWKYDSSSEEWMLKETEYLDCISLATGGGREFTRTISGKTFGTGEFAIGLCADGDGTQVELDESDNNEFVYFTVSKDNVAKSSSGVDWQFKKLKSAEPDSFFLSASSSMKKKTTTFKVGQRIYMRRAFWNAKKKSVNGSVTSAYWLNGTCFLKSTTDISYIKAKAIVYNTDKSPDFLQNLPAGKYTLTATIDSDNNWTETNEKNNIRTISFTVVAAPTIYGEATYTCALNESVNWPVSSEGSMTVKGLPPGLEYSGGAIVGKATKVGTYTVKITSKNAKGSVSKNIKIIVTNPGFEVSIAKISSSTSDNPSVNVGSGSVVQVYVGVNQRFTLDATPKKDGGSKSAVSSITVSGLPSGMEYSNGVISGAPTKTGTYAIKVVFKNALKWSETFTWKMTVLSIPEWARGRFYGEVHAPEVDAVSENFSMSIGSTGKISGKFKLGGTNWTFSASSFVANAGDVDEPEFVCSVKAKATVKVGKKEKTVVCPLDFALVRDNVSEIASQAEGTFGDGDFYAWRRPGVNIAANSGGTIEMGKSYGQVAEGEGLELVAKPKKGYVFAGWYEDADCTVPLEGAWQDTKYTFTGRGVDTFLFAKFLKASSSEAKAISVFMDAEYTVTPGVNAKIPVDVKSGCRCTVKASNLPDGLTLKRYSNGNYRITGKATTPCRKTVKLKITNDANSEGITHKFKISVVAPPIVVDVALRDFVDGTSSNVESGSALAVYVGVKQEFSIGAEGLEGVANEFKVSGLPKGLAYEDGKIAGVPAKAGVYTVEIGASNKWNWEGSASFRLEVVALPEWARGRFYGEVHAPEVDAVSENFSMSIGSTGKISGKFKLGGTNWTFSASSFVANAGDVDEPEFVCSVKAKATVKVGKKEKTVVCPLDFALVRDNVSEIASQAEGTFGDGDFHAWRRPGVKIEVNSGGKTELSKSYGQAFPGDELKFTAAPKKGYVFCGWYEDAGYAVPCDSSKVDYRSPEYVYVMGEEDRIFHARFELAQADGELALYVNEELISPDDKPRKNFIAEGKMNLYLEVDSLSLPSVSVSGLPSGVKFSASKNKIYGTPKTPGIYTVTVKLTNATVTKAVKRKFTIEVPK